MAFSLTKAFVIISILCIQFSVDYHQLLERHLEHEKLEIQRQEEEDEALVK